MQEEAVAIKVIKRDGGIEDFDSKKIERVCDLLGLSPSQEKYLISNIIKKIKKNAVEGAIPSSVIREYVIGELKNIDEYTAEQFIWYYKINSASQT